MRRRSRAVVTIVLGAAIWPITPSAAPAGPTIDVRLKSPLGTTKSKRGDAVEAVTITSLVVNGKVIATPGCVMPGLVVESLRPKGLKEREVVSLEFKKLVARNNVTHAIETTVADVDNARETVDGDGRILGVAPVEKSESGTDFLKTAAGGVQIMKSLMAKAVGRIPPQIDYKPGAELILRVTKAPTAASIVCGPVPPQLPQSEALSKVVNAQPLRTLTKTGGPSDVTNLVFIGTREQMAAGFAAAGWSTAEALSATSGAKTFLATVAGAGYSEAPVSEQFIDGKLPDLVFQKQLNTFAERHHLRIWRAKENFNGQPVWISAATHDTAFVLSKEVKLFTHGIDPEIDFERLKIVNDLSFAGAVASHTLVARPRAPRTAQTSIGETVRTDGRAAVIVLKKP